MYAILSTVVTEASEVLVEQNKALPALPCPRSGWVAVWGGEGSVGLGWFGGFGVVWIGKGCRL